MSTILLRCGVTHGIGLLYGWTICNRIREGYTEFNDISTTLLHGKQNRHRVILGRVTCGHEGHQRRDVLGNFIRFIALVYSRCNSYLVLFCFKDFLNGLHDGNRVLVCPILEVGHVQKKTTTGNLMLLLQVVPTGNCLICQSTLA